MIQPQELRCNNIVTRGNGSILKVSAIICIVIKGTDNYKPYDTILPIHLTEEWLMKAGFTRNGTERMLEYNDTTFIIEARDGEYYYTGGQGVMLSRLFTSVHQLQNVFHALTGEELKIEI